MHQIKWHDINMRSGVEMCCSRAAAVDVYLFPVFTTGCRLDYSIPFLLLCVSVIVYSHTCLLALTSFSLSRMFSLVSFSYSFLIHLIFPEVLSFFSCVKV